MAVNNLWPEGKRFAFTIFDDTDIATLENVRNVYSFLADQGFRTTKSCWSLQGNPNQGKHPGQTLEDAEYRQWLLELVSNGFGVDWHGATWHSSPREDVIAGLDRFAEVFGEFPTIATNHSVNEESIYWGDARLTGWRRFAYNAITRRHNRGKYRGHVERDTFFWGDICRERIKYVRNFVYRDINTLKACPMMPYHDRTKPFVRYWFASSNGANIEKFNRCISEAAQDRLEAEGGACIMYAHFTLGFNEGGKLDSRFKQLMERLAKKNGWFVPCEVLLDRLLDIRGYHELTNAERRRLECRWFWEKLSVGRD